MFDLTRQGARALDRADVLQDFRKRFTLPPDLVYLDGISLGALPRSTLSRITRVIDREWGCDLVRSWNSHDWLNSPSSLGDKIAELIGAEAGEVVVTDTTSVNLFRLVLAALELNPDRVEVVSEAGNFPTDLYVCGGATEAYGRGRRSRVVPRSEVLDCVGEATALLVLTHVHYKSSEMYDLAAITHEAQARGAMVLWDLSHSVGAVPVDLNAAGADFAVGCGYKYLNGGPGAPAFLFVAKRHQAVARNAISGWHGHALPFDFTDDYVPANGIRRFLAGTPSIIANCALEAGVDIVREAKVDRLAAKSRQMSEYFIKLVETGCAEYGIKLASPRAVSERGSHVSYAHPHGYEIIQALIERSVIGDFRAPDIMRFGFAPLYTRFEDVWIAANELRLVLEGASWQDPRFALRAAVT